MADPIAHIRAPIASPEQFDGVFISERPDLRGVVALFEPQPGVDERSVEKAAWSLTISEPGKGHGRPVRVVESGVLRGPVLKLRLPGGNTHEMHPGSWQVGFHLDEPTWQAYRAGRADPRSLLKRAMEPQPRKETKMGKSKELKRVLKEIDDLQNRVTTMGAAGRRNALGATGLATILRAPGAASSVFKALEDDFEVAKARWANNRMDRGLETEMRQAGWRLTAAKFIAQENVRQEHPRRFATRFGPNTTPLLANSHELANDSALRYR